jgi:DNA-binding NarL/FixJ family response regulator
MHKILILDDDITLRNAITTFFQNEKFTVISLGSVYAVLVFLKKHSTDLIIADIMMPELDGYDLLTILKSYSKYSLIPIILLTAKGITYDKVKGYDLGCNIYITKPFAPYELLSVVNNLLNINNPILQNNIIDKQDFDVDVLKVSLPIFTEREQSILNLVVKGYTNKEIANSLQLSIRNVEKYVSRLLYKTNTRNRTEFVNYILNS